MAKLRPRARIVRTIGDQLISGPEAALIELVKNSYDADSPDISIKITPPRPDIPVGCISVKDNGHGMSQVDIITRWFEPATDDKLNRKFSPNERRMLGAKGIGRFAASRLGSKTTLNSIGFDPEQNIKEQVLVQIDWDEFSANKYLEDIEIPTQSNSVENNINTGLELTITHLRDVWSKKRLENLIRELRRVITPSETSQNFNIYLDLSDFKTGEIGFDGSELLNSLNYDLTNELDNQEPKTTVSLNNKYLIVPFKLQNHADYKLVGSFDEVGTFNGTFTICKGDNLPAPIYVDAPKLEADEENCGVVNIDINVYDREADSIEELFKRMGLQFESIGIRAARQILTDNAGIAIFRNGFRIRPYGEPENDWLELERQRVQDPSKKLGLSQVSGSVSIGEESESGLIERSSREGLEHNGYFDRLKKLILRIMLHIEERRLAFKEKAGLSRKKSGDVSQVKKIAALNSVSNAVSSLPLNLQEPIRKAIAKDASALTASLDEIDEYQKILQSRASLGLVVAQVIHEGRRILNPMSASAKALFDSKDSLLEDSKLGEIFRRQLPDNVATIQAGTKNMSRLFKRLDPVSGRRRGKPVIFNLKEVIDSSVSLFSDSITNNNIKINIDATTQLRTYGYIEDLQAGILNILENAIHWLSSSPQESKNINISAKPYEKYVELSIENDGPLIDDNYIPRLFSPGFSLKSDGTGLGLSIAREACRASKGELAYKEGAPNTCFIIQFPTPSVN